MTDNERRIAEDYLVTPTLGDGPGVLVLHSGRGLTEFTRTLCHRLAREGFVALAPDIFNGAEPTSIEEADALKADANTDSTFRELEDSGEFLRQHESVSRQRIGLIGIGFGAELACRLAGRLGELCGGVVIFYGYQPADWAAVSAPILAHFAELDQEIPESVVNSLREELVTHDIDADLFIYDGTEPSFFEADVASRYEPGAANLAWERTAQFLKSRLREQ